jgi:deoxycytidylate deaminase
MFIIKCKKLYLGNLEWTSDINLARVFKRKEDAKKTKWYKPEYKILEILVFEKVKRKRPNWDNYFFGLAKLVSQRSHDIHTQHGCVIVDPEKHIILGCGYNGFPRDMEDNTLPLTRPEKYDWMIHSEVNACSNLITKPEIATAYVTGEVCHPCLVHLWQNGIDEVLWLSSGTKTRLITNEMAKNTRKFLSQVPMKVTEVQADLSWLNGISV